MLANLVGVVNKPQFDVDIFKLGKAVHVKEIAASGYGLKSVDGIISVTNRLYLEVTYYDEKKYTLTDMEISIEDLVKGKYEIVLLKEDV